MLSINSIIYIEHSLVLADELADLPRRRRRRLLKVEHHVKVAAAPAEAVDGRAERRDDRRREDAAKGVLDARRHEEPKTRVELRQTLVGVDGAHLSGDLRARVTGGTGRGSQSAWVGAGLKIRQNSW